MIARWLLAGALMGSVLLPAELAMTATETADHAAAQLDMLCSFLELERSGACGPW